MCYQKILCNISARFIFVFFSLIVMALEITAKDLAYEVHEILDENWGYRKALPITRKKYWKRIKYYSASRLISKAENTGSRLPIFDKQPQILRVTLGSQDSVATCSAMCPDGRFCHRTSQKSNPRQCSIPFSF